MLTEEERWDARKRGAALASELAVGYLTWGEVSGEVARAVEAQARAIGRTRFPDVTTKIELPGVNADDQGRFLVMALVAGVIGTGILSALFTSSVGIPLGAVLTVAGMIYMLREVNKPSPPLRRTTPNPQAIKYARAWGSLAMHAADARLERLRADMPVRSLAPEPTANEEMTFAEAETFVAQYMRHQGEPGVSVTQATRDGGVDVESDHFVAQVKHTTVNVAPNVVRAIYGVAMSKGKRAAVFTLTGYSIAALEFADANGIVLFIYDPKTAVFTPKSRSAREVVWGQKQSVAVSEPFSVARRR